MSEEQRGVHVPARVIPVPKTISVARSDIYHGGRVVFVPLTRLEGDVIRGIHGHK